MSSIIRWGILGCGHIAHSFAHSMQFVENAEISAVASRTPGKAAKFAAQFKVARSFTTYEDLVAQADLDVIYIATTHNFHYANMLLCLENNKAVLCEKAFTLNRFQAEDVFQRARAKKLFVMEGMWMKFNPCFQYLQNFIREGKIGDVRLIKANFGIHVPFNPSHRLYNPNLAGGSLLDLGVYPLTFARVLYEKSPVRIESTAYLGKTGVDEESSYILEFPEKKQAMLYASCRVETPHVASIFGTMGRIQVPNFFHPSGFEWTYNNDSKVQKVDLPYDSPGYQYEIEEVNFCLQKGKMESKIQSWTDSLEIMSLMDNIRQQWRLKYPDEIK